MGLSEIIGLTDQSNMISNLIQLINQNIKQQRQLLYWGDYELIQQTQIKANQTPWPFFSIFVLAQQYQINCRPNIIIQNYVKMSDLSGELPRIVFTIPCDQYLIITHPFTSSTFASPIKQFDIESTIEQAAQDYQRKFGGDMINNDTHINAQCHHIEIPQSNTLRSTTASYCEINDGTVTDSSPRRKLNLGQKVRSKLETTTNKSPPISISYLKEGTNTTPFDVSFGNGDPDSLLNEQQLYESANLQNASNCINNQKQNQHLQLNVPLAESSIVQQSDEDLLIDWGHSNQKKLSQIQLKMKCSVSSSPYNNMSAKTQNSPIDAELSGSPINELQSMANYQERSQNMEVQVLFQGSTDLNQGLQPVSSIRVSQFENQHRIIKLHKVQDEHQIQNIQIGDIPVVRSRVIEHEYPSSIQAVESRCIPCSNDDCEDWIKSYQFAMQQLAKLQQNVVHLESATANLAAIKNNQSQHNSLMPSTIGRGTYQSNALEESFVRLLNVFDGPDSHQDLIEQNSPNSRVIHDLNTKSADRDMNIKLRINLAQKFTGNTQVHQGKENRVINLQN